MTALADTAKQIRAALKKELGFSRKQVSVRKSRGCAVNVKVKTWEVLLSDVREVVKGFESVSRCEYSGEVLSGGNTFVFVGYDSEALAPLVEMAREELEAGNWRETLDVLGVKLHRHERNKDQYSVVVGMGFGEGFIDSGDFVAGNPVAPYVIARQLAHSGILVQGAA